MLLAGAFGIGLAAALSLAELGREYRAMPASLQGAPMTLLTLAATGDRPPASFRARRGLMEACDTALRGPYGGMQPQELRDRLATGCAAMAGAILARSPTDALAHLVRAEVRLYAGDRAGFAAALAVAQRTAPAEGWIALRRADLAASAPDAAGETLAADLALLLGAPETLAPLARLYRRHEALRPLIADLAGMQPPAMQARFLAYLRSQPR